MEQHTVRCDRVRERVRDAAKLHEFGCSPRDDIRSYGGFPAQSAPDARVQIVVGNTVIDDDEQVPVAVGAKSPRARLPNSQTCWGFQRETIWLISDRMVAMSTGCKRAGTAPTVMARRQHEGVAILGGWPGAGGGGGETI
jgi:hypothetical protein